MCLTWDIFSQQCQLLNGISHQQSKFGWRVIWVYPLQTGRLLYYISRELALARVCLVCLKVNSYCSALNRDRGSHLLYSLHSSTDIITFAFNLKGTVHTKMKIQSYHICARHMLLTVISHSHHTFVIWRSYQDVEGMMAHLGDSASEQVTTVQDCTYTWNNWIF